MRVARGKKGEMGGKHGMGCVAWPVTTNRCVRVRLDVSVGGPRLLLDLELGRTQRLTGEGSVQLSNDKHSCGGFPGRAGWGVPAGLDLHAASRNSGNVDQTSSNILRVK